MLARVSVQVSARSGAAALRFAQLPESRASPILRREPTKYGTALTQVQLNRQQRRTLFRGSKTALFRFPGVEISHATKPLPTDMGSPAQQPLVVMIGWLGANVKNLRKYVQWYNERGYDVVYYVPPAFLTLFPFRMETLCNTIAVALSEHHQFITAKRATMQQSHHIGKVSGKKVTNPEPAPLLFHVFSNNGYFNLCFLLHFIKHGDPKYRYLLDLIKGAVVDSAPSKLTPAVLTRGMIAAFFAKPHQLTYEDEFWTPIMMKMWTFLLKSKFVQHHWVFANSLLEAAHDRDDWPYLFYYSDADKMVLPEDTIEHIELLRRHGIDVEEHNFHTSRHVEHMRSYPREYSAILEEFLKKKVSKNIRGPADNDAPPATPTM